ncbi:hypothetical protein FIU91_03910 [Roseivivax sp. THAF30]|nr:hypothetical protein FIU91_03910 [Roseivivax sp. THAF30]
MQLLKICAFILICSSSALADPHPMRLGSHPFNGSVQPVTEDGVTRFEIRNHECSSRKYGDGRGESDCLNGNVRSSLTAHQANNSSSWTYEFQFRVPGPIGYSGWRNSHACGFLPGCEDSRLRIASWEGNRLHNFLYMLKLDSRHGARFLDQTCVKPEDLEEWSTFRMEVHWSNNDRGWIRVSCDDRVIHFREGNRTAEAPHCYITNLCQDGSQKRPSRVLTILGPVMQGFGHEWRKRGKPHQFTDFYADIRVEMRNIVFTPEATLYDDETSNAVRELQAHLLALGCDPGPVDAAMGPKTRDSALTCRNMSEFSLPTEINAETVSQWLKAYKDYHPL